MTIARTRTLFHLPLRSASTPLLMKLTVFLLLPLAQALNNGLGLTPPLGYNAYDHVGCCANETTMKQQGQALLDTGLHALGFTYVNTDCGWMGGRTPGGAIFESKVKFPSGLHWWCCWC